MTSAAGAPLAGRVAIVSGASRGLGRAYALALAAAGAQVLALARTAVGSPDEPGSLAELSATAAARGLVVETRGCDVADAAQVRAAVAHAAERFGGIDVLVNNAAAGIRQIPLLEVPDDEWEAVFRTNVRAPYLFLREAVPHMAARGGGAIVNITSGAAGRTVPGSLAHGYPVYGVSKAALDRLTTYSATELEGADIAVNALSPGHVAWVTRDGAEPAIGFWGPPLVHLAAARPSAGGPTGAILHTYGFGRDWGPRFAIEPDWDPGVRHILAEAGLL